MDDDILQPLGIDDIKKLIGIYKTNSVYPHACYIYNYLNSVIRWKLQSHDSDWIQLYAPCNNLQDGTFVGIHKFWCYELLLFTFDKTCETLCNVLLKTKRICWSEDIMIYSLYDDYHLKVLQALKNTDFVYSQTFKTDVFWISKEEARIFEVDGRDEVFISRLEPKHAELINRYWPPRYKRRNRDSQQYLAKFIEFNGGYGVFLKSNGKLVSWCLRNLLGLGALQTLQDYKRKGYGSLVVKALSREFAEEGFDPLGTVNVGNDNSASMFKKLGFIAFESVVYIPSKFYEVTQ